MEAAKQSTWMDSAWWHVLGWVAILGCSLITLVMLGIGIAKAVKGRGHDLWISMAVAFVVGVVLHIAVRM